MQRDLHHRPAGAERVADRSDNEEDLFRLRRRFPTMTAAILASLEPRDVPASTRLWIYDDNGERASYTYQEITLEGLRWAAWYRSVGCVKGDVIFIGLPTGLEHIGALLGSILLGVIPCTVPLGTDEQVSQGSLHHTSAAYRVIKPRLFITTARIREQRQLIQDFPASLLIHVEPGERLTPLPLSLVAQSSPSDLSHLQLTSGSTAAPKAAGLSHSAVVANIDAVLAAFHGDASKDAGCCWLPMFHDMGLMQLLMVIYQRADMVLQSPGSFLRNPLGWLERISNHGSTLAAAPTFAYSYCVRRYRPDLAAELDLSRWRLAGVGAERVEHRVLREFQDCYARHGFRADAFANCYGMAEAGFAVSMPTTPGSSVASESVPTVGTPVSGMEIQVRDADGHCVPDGVQGRLYLRGSSLMSGYYAAPEATAQAFLNGWYQTGDLGFRRNGEYFVLGREKELVILRGRNYYPQEFEQCVAEHPDVGLHRCVALGIYQEHAGTEALVLLVEPRILRNLDPLRQSLQQLLRARFGFGAQDILFLSSGGIPRTTSHKAQRDKCRALYTSGEIGALEASARATHPQPDPVRDAHALNTQRGAASAPEERSGSYSPCGERR
jgi:acyl-CoA synthetase (AMP-forming)/AMP-acid ligase II